MKKWYVFSLLLSLTFISFDQVVGMDSMRSVLHRFVAPISYGLYSIGYTVSDAVTFVGGLPYVHMENRQLREENDTMRAHLVAQNDLIRENQLLREQLGVQGARVTKRILARSIGAQNKSNDIVLIVDKGSYDGIIVGNVVVVGEYLIGRIIEVSDTQSYVLPIFSVSSRVPAYIQQDEGDTVSGLSVGHFNNRSAFTEVLQEENIQKGDIVITSGEGGTYPRGLILGVVDSIKSTDTELFKSASLSTGWNLRTLRTVFIITP